MAWRPVVELQDGESIAYEAGIDFGAVGPGVVLSLGLAEPWRRLVRYVVTDRRVLVLTGAPGGRKVQSIPLSRVQDAVVAQSLWQGRVTITSAGGSPGVQKIGPMKVGNARRFAEAVLAGASKSAGAPV